MIETVTALLLFLNGSMIEHVYKPDLGACLKSKRIASRELNPERVVFSCKIVKAKIELDDQAKYGKPWEEETVPLYGAFRTVGGWFRPRYIT